MRSYKTPVMDFETIFDPDHDFLWYKWTTIALFDNNVQLLRQEKLNNKILIYDWSCLKNHEK